MALTFTHIYVGPSTHDGLTTKSIVRIIRHSAGQGGRVIATTDGRQWITHARNLEKMNDPYTPTLAS